MWKISLLLLGVLLLAGPGRAFAAGAHTARFEQDTTRLAISKVSFDRSHNVLRAEIAKRVNVPVHYDLVDVLGHSILGASVTGTTLTIPAAPLPNGEYTLRVASGGEKASARLTIRH